MNDKHIPKFAVIKDESMKLALFNFIDSLELSDAALKKISSYLAEYKDINLHELTWETLCDIATKIDTSSRNSNLYRFGDLNLRFVNYLIKNNLFNDDNIEVIENLIDMLLPMSNAKSHRLILFDKNVNLSNKDITKSVVIKDESMKSAIFNYIDSIQLSCHIYKRINLYLAEYKDIQLAELTWETLCDIGKKIDTVKDSALSIFGIINLRFVDYLIKNNLFNDDNTEVIDKLIAELLPMKNAKDNRLILFDKKVDPFNIIAFTKGGGQYFVDTKLNNTFIVELLKDFCISDLFGSRNTDYTIIENFVNSYTDFSTFTEISDFNYSVFKEQYDYYKNNYSQLKTLVKFYIYLHTISGGAELFKDNDPVDMNYIQRTHFLSEYGKGFELVNYNPFDPVPQIDKWMLKPNGAERLSSIMASKLYLLIDFADIEYEPYRNMAKEWFWHYKVTLATKQSDLRHIKYFLNFIYEKKKKIVDLSTGKTDYTTITRKDAIAYASNIFNKNVAPRTFNKRTSLVRSFINFCKNEKYLTTEFGVYDDLAHIEIGIPKGGNDIPKEHLILIENRLREISDENPVYELYHIVFHLLIDTHVRISSLLKLETTQIQEAMKKGEYNIVAPHKTSNGDYETQPISNYAYRHLELAKKLTAALRSEAPDEYSNYIFLQQDNAHNKKDVRRLRTEAFRVFLKEQCRHLKIPEYTASNLRDTHMTLGIEFAIENKLNKLQVNAAISNHKSIITTNNHYVNHEMQLFAEALYGVIIGDVDIKGNIIASENTEYSKADTVDDGCGFCKEQECYMINEIGCPLCKSFVVTLDRMPFYEKKLDDIDNHIANEGIEHEREHLQSLKRLYAAYLSKLFELKAALQNNQEEGVING